MSNEFDFEQAEVQVGSTEPSAIPTIPDSIEVVTGWKAFTYYFGHIRSPQQNSTWPSKEALCADCNTAHQTPTWAPVTPPTTYNSYNSTSFVQHSNDSATAAAYGLGPRPEGILVPPLVWGIVWHMSKPDHSPPDETCSCGIYMVKDISHAVSYASVNFLGDNVHCLIFGKVAGWGKVIPAGGGYRVEKAYPQELWIHGTTEAYEQMVDKLAHYGVPVKHINPNGAVDDLAAAVGESSANRIALRIEGKVTPVVKVKSDALASTNFFQIVGTSTRQASYSTRVLHVMPLFLVGAAGLNLGIAIFRGSIISLVSFLIAMLACMVVIFVRIME